MRFAAWGLDPVKPGGNRRSRKSGRGEKITALTPDDADWATMERERRGTPHSKYSGPYEIPDALIHRLNRSFTLFVKASSIVREIGFYLGMARENPVESVDRSSGCVN